MSTDPSSPPPSASRRLARTAPGSAVYAALAFVGAGRLDWGRGWLYAAVFVVVSVAGTALSTATLLVNTHAESTVRIQSDRDHAVVRSGPYRVVRHPMYLGTLIGMSGAALMLGSGWALLPALLIAALFVWRTAREDEALHRELPGYADYASTTRFRLLPGVW
ncbi:methyltransferase family protein [Rhodopseudomonas telluris]|uniref:Methyltransferase family protein n=2 Tax=Rhodopseudomonas telluris TaxID=644215 RepID=A0ABV6EMM9_9BRAD